MNCNQAVAIVRPGSNIDPRYLRHYLESPTAQLEMAGFGVTGTITNLSLSQVAQLRVPIRSLNEQRRIAAILDQADSLRVRRKFALAKTDAATAAFFASAFRHLDRLPRLPLSAVVSKITNGFVGPTREIYQETGVPYLLARHVKSNSLVFDGNTHVSESFNLRHKKSVLKAGDVLLVQSGHIGESAVVPKSLEGANCHAMIVLAPRPEFVSGIYLSHLFATPAFRKRFRGIQTGITLGHLNCRDVSRLEIPLPAISAQKRFEEHTHSVTALKQKNLHQLKKLDALFQSLQHRAFRGEL